MIWTEAAKGVLQSPTGRWTAPTEANVSFVAGIGQRLIETGVIRQIQDVEIVTSPQPVYASVILQGGHYPNGHTLVPRICGGSGFTPDEARIRAYGEAAERYCAALYDEQKLQLASRQHIGGNATSPHSFVLYSKEQYLLPGFEYRPFLDDSQVNWVEGFSLTHQKPVFVPAAFVYLPYWPTGGETAIGLATSTGLACGASLLEATLRALMEVVERDAIMHMWLLQHAGRRIEANTCQSDRVKQFVTSTEHGALRLFDITTDLEVPTRFALLTDMYRGRSLVSCGAATDWDASAAEEKAVREAVVLRRAVEKIIRTNPPRNYGKDYEKVRELEDHINLFTNPEMIQALAFLTGMSETPEPEDLSTMAGRSAALQLESCIELLAEQGLETIVVDITRPEVAECGLCVVRVIVPGTIPLSFGARYVCAGGSRLVEAARASGRLSRSGRLQFNPVPHPFA
ncbi:MAG TPA: YcaO-like family protein [Anaerolineales bacterium]|nr:YcaO-like family protein [Anaerolineales bacterium]